MAHPSAVSSYDETRPDLLYNPSGNDLYLLDNAGLIEETRYGTATTATQTTPGDRTRPGLADSNGVHATFAGSATDTGGIATVRWHFDGDGDTRITACSPPAARSLHLSPCPIPRRAAGGCPGQCGILGKGLGGRWAWNTPEHGLPRLVRWFPLAGRQAPELRSRAAPANRDCPRWQLGYKYPY